MRSDEVVLLLEDERLVMQRQGADVKIAITLLKSFQTRFVARVFAVAISRIPSPVEPVQVGAGEGQSRRRIILVETEQLLEKTNGPQHRRGRLRVTRLRRRIPCQKSLG